ncbi:MAG: hypothetical protein R2701_08710 [Acidimicrobiales bacterium]
MTDPRFESVGDVRDRLRKVDYLSDEGIAGIVYLADRLQKPILVEARPAPARPSWPSRWPR